MNNVQQALLFMMYTNYIITYTNYVQRTPGVNWSHTLIMYGVYTYTNYVQQSLVFITNIHYVQQLLVFITYTNYILDTATPGVYHIH